MWVLMIAAANAVLTITVTKSEIFRPIRECVSAYNAQGNHTWIYKLLSCPYCFSHWGAMMLVTVGYWGEITKWWVIYWLVVVALTAPIMLALGWCLQTLSGLEEGEES